MYGDTENDGFGPIPKKRSKGKERIMLAQFLLTIAFTAVLMVCRMMLSVKLYSFTDFYFVIAAVSLILVSEFIRRCSLFAEEYHHADERYRGSKMAAFGACCSLSNRKGVSIAVFIGSLAYTINSWINKEEFVFPFILFTIVSLVISVCGNLLEIDQITEVEISTRDESEPKNVSAGAAWGYYFGYLKLILPTFQNIFVEARGDNFQVDCKDIQDLVTDTSLFIIIPKDGYCYKEFIQVDNRIKYEHAMKELKINRGGVQDRVYKNSLYKIDIPDKRVKYAVMEYASPLLGFYDMAQSSKVFFTEEEKEQEIMQFYIRLKKIIDNDQDCVGKCKLILTGPVTTNDIDNQKKLSDIMWENIENKR